MEREVFAIIEMHKNIKTFGKIDGKRPKEFEVKVHQGSNLSLLLFVVVMDEITKNVRKNPVKELLDAGDLVLLGDSSKVEKRYA